MNQSSFFLVCLPGKDNLLAVFTKTGLYDKSSVPILDQPTLRSLHGGGVFWFGAVEAWDLKKKEFIILPHDYYRFKSIVVEHEKGDKYQICTCVHRKIMKSPAFQFIDYSFADFFGGRHFYACYGLNCPFATCDKCTPLPPDVAWVCSSKCAADANIRLYIDCCGPTSFPSMKDTSCLWRVTIYNSETSKMQDIHPCFNKATLDARDAAPTLCKHHNEELLSSLFILPEIMDMGSSREPLPGIDEIIIESAKPIVWVDPFNFSKWN